MTATTTTPRQRYDAKLGALPDLLDAIQHTGKLPDDDPVAAARQCIDWLTEWHSHLEDLRTDTNRDDAAQLADLLVSTDQFDDYRRQVLLAIVRHVLGDPANDGRYPQDARTLCVDAEEQAAGDAYTIGATATLRPHPLDPMDRRTPHGRD